MMMRQGIQKFGRALSAMVMPNIGAFIAWGFITALFIPSGWWPDERLAKLVPAMLTYLLPLLIGYTGGRNAGGDRGGVIGAIATVGVIAGSEIPMFIGAMIMGPLAGWCIKKFDHLVEGKVKAGFEMLVNNFSIGIIGMLLAILGYLVIGNIVTWLTLAISAGADVVIRHGLLPLVSLFVEPAKVLFLNNAVNHGIFSPIGIEQAREFGSSIMFLIETNPGPGVGMLLAYWIFGRGNEKQSAPGAIIIQFFGGIHEIYFPYILARPVLILSTIAGSASALLFYSLTGAGLVAPASPGSIISVLAMAPKGMTLTILAGVLISAAVSFAVAMPFIRLKKTSPDENPSDGENGENTDISSAGRKTSGIRGTVTGLTGGKTGIRTIATGPKGKTPGIRATVTGLTENTSGGQGADRQGNASQKEQDTDRQGNASQGTQTSCRQGNTSVNGNAANRPVHKIVFVCDAGMGSSALGATRFRQRLQKAGIGTEVTNSAADRIPENADVIVCQAIIARRLAGDKDESAAGTGNNIGFYRGSEVVVIDNFLSDKHLDDLFIRLQNTRHDNADNSADSAEESGTGTAVTETGSDRHEIRRESGPTDGETDTAGQGDEHPQTGKPDRLLTEQNIAIGLRPESKEDAIRRAGKMLAEGGYVKPDYIEAMVEREKLSTTYMGMGIAIPHGTSEAKAEVLHSGIVVLQYPDGVDFGEEKARLVIGIAGVGDDHLSILANLAGVLEDEELLDRLSSTSDISEIYNALKQE